MPALDQTRWAFSPPTLSFLRLRSFSYPSLFLLSLLFLFHFFSPPNPRAPLFLLPRPPSPPPSVSRPRAFPPPPPRLSFPFPPRGPGSLGPPPTAAGSPPWAQPRVDAPAGDEAPHLRAPGLPRRPSSRPVPPSPLPPLPLPLRPSSAASRPRRPRRCRPRRHRRRRPGLHRRPPGRAPPAGPAPARPSTAEPAPGQGRGPLDKAGPRPAGAVRRRAAPRAHRRRRRRRWGRRAPAGGPASVPGLTAAGGPGAAGETDARRGRDDGPLAAWDGPRRGGAPRGPCAHPRRPLWAVRPAPAATIKREKEQRRGARKGRGPYPWGPHLSPRTWPERFDERASTSKEREDLREIWAQPNGSSGEEQELRWALGAAGLKRGAGRRASEVVGGWGVGRTRRES